MRPIKLYIAASIDGYIALPDGNIDWLHAPAYQLDGEDFGYQALLDTIDTTLMGNTTFEQICSFDIPFPYTDKTNYVFSRNKTHTDTEFVKFVTEDIVGFVQKLKSQPGKAIWLIGGGQVNTLLLNHGLIDEIIITYIPIVLGAGVPLFAPTARTTNLQAISSKLFDNGLIQIKYKPIY